MPDFTPYIYRYHSSNRPSLYFNGGENCEDNLFLGIELEFDTRNSRIGWRDNKLDLIEESNLLWGNNTFIYYMNDGSLHNGLEMITQPATFEYHVANKEKYKELFDIIKKHGFKSQSFKNCGLHIHFNKNFFKNDADLYIMNLLYIVEKFWREFVLFSRRNYDSVQRWSDKYSKKPEEIVGDMHKLYCNLSRYKAVNLTNRNTIEFRIYKGTLDIDDFFATLEFTKNVIYCAKTYSPIELQNMTFEKLIETSPELVRYWKKCNRKSAINKLPSTLR